MYVLQAWKDRRMIPCAWILMNRRRKKDYIKVSKALKKEARKHNLTLKPKTCMFDFELAAITAFEKSFAGIKAKGCTFHFGQSLLRNLANMGLKNTYIENDEFRYWIKRIFALSIIPKKPKKSMSRIQKAYF